MQLYESSVFTTDGKNLKLKTTKNE